MGTPKDYTEGRRGAWMHTSLGGRFYPLDPRPEEIFISNIANGLAQETRYGGQAKIEMHYTVAEHCVHLSWYALKTMDDPMLAWAMLMHDAVEGLGLKDLPRAVKEGAGEGYREMEHRCEAVVFAKYELSGFMAFRKSDVKELDCRITSNEKPAVMRYTQPWAFDQFAPLGGVVIEGWQQREAKRRWLAAYSYLMDRLDMKEEKWEL